jgi:S1-C subfamily serine protease
LGFAVSANVAKQLLLSTGSFWTGIEGMLVTDQMARVLNIPQPAGLLIQRVAAGSPGALLGLRPGTVGAVVQDQEIILGGDIVLEIGGLQVSEAPGIEDRAEHFLRSLPPGSPITVKVLRGGQVLMLTATRQP